MASINYKASMISRSYCCRCRIRDNNAINRYTSGFFRVIEMKEKVSASFAILLALAMVLSTYTSMIVPSSVIASPEGDESSEGGSDSSEGDQPEEPEPEVPEEEPEP